MSAITEQTQPWYLDIFWRHFHGRSYDATEGGTNTTLASPAAAGDTTLALVLGTGFVAGELIVAGAGTVWQSFTVEAVNSNTLTVAPRVRSEGFTAGTGVYHGWANDAHPGFSQSYQAIAALLAATKRRSVTGGANRLGSTVGALDTTYTDARGTANVPVGWESLGTAACTATAYATGDVLPAARNAGGTQVQAAAVGDGLRTLATIAVTPGEPVVVTASARHLAGTGFTLQVVDKANPGTVIAQLAAVIGDRTNFDYRVFAEPVVLGFAVPAGVSGIELRFVSTGTTDQAGLDDVRVLGDRQAATEDRYVFEDPGTERGFCWLGDSWSDGASELAELFRQQLETRFGHVFPWHNSSVPGNRLDNMLTRFETDVRPFNPRYCVLQYGINDVSAQRSQALMEADATQAIALCQGAGITPVFLGIPPYSLQKALSQQRNEQIRALVDTASGASVTILGVRRVGAEIWVEGSVDGTHQSLRYAPGEYDRIPAAERQAALATALQSLVSLAAPAGSAGYSALRGLLTGVSVSGVTVNWIVNQGEKLVVDASVNGFHQVLYLDPAAFGDLGTLAAQKEFLAAQLGQAAVTRLPGNMGLTGTLRV